MDAWDEQIPGAARPGGSGSSPCLGAGTREPTNQPRGRRASEPGGEAALSQGRGYTSRPVLLDVLIALTLLIAVFVGFQRGFIQPLLVELSFLLTLLILFHDRRGYLDTMSRYFHVNAVLAVFLGLIVAVVIAFFAGRLGGLIHRMPVVRGADGFVGVFGQAFVAILVCYSIACALIALDHAFTPTVNAATLSLAQVEGMRKQLASNSLVSNLVDWKDFKRLEEQAKKPGGARIGEAPQLNQLASIYEDFLQPQLAGSRLVPVVLGIGQRVPGIGKYGPRDLPPRASPQPTPAVSPRKT